MLRHDAPAHLDYGTRDKASTSINYVTLIIGGALIIALHCGLQFFLYRARIVGRSLLANSDLVVFGAPIFLALTCFALLFGQLAMTRDWYWTGKLMFVVLMALLFGALSTLWSCTIAFNIYGT